MRGDGAQVDVQLLAGHAYAAGGVSVVLAGRLCREVSAFEYAASLSVWNRGICECAADYQRPGQLANRKHPMTHKSFGFADSLFEGASPPISSERL